MESDDMGSTRRRPFSCKRFCRTYFCEGQATKETLKAMANDHGADGSTTIKIEVQGDDDAASSTVEIQHESQQMKNEGPDAQAADVSSSRILRSINMHRKAVGLVGPALIVHIVWWAWMITYDRFEVFTRTSGGKDIPRWYMSITMVFGSMLAGATSEGGSAVAFPVMTLAFGIAPSVARDFSFMIQSVGMTAAALTILWMRVLIEWKAIVFATVGGVAGIILGLEKINLDPPYAKMYFVVIWGSFAASLYWLNRMRGRKV